MQLLELSRSVDVPLLQRGFESAPASVVVVVIHTPTAVHVEGLAEYHAPLHQRQLLEQVEAFHVTVVAVAGEEVDHLRAEASQRGVLRICVLDSLPHQRLEGVALLLWLCLVLDNILDHRHWIQNELDVVVSSYGVRQ